MTESFDHVIVGGGSAGSALANRLSADPARRVLVLESGRPDYSWDVLMRMPAGIAFTRGVSFYDWRYQSEPEPGLRGRRMNLPAGRMLGGTSNLYGMLYQRGNPLDYEGWAALPGMENWGFAHVLPYFKRMEDAEVGGPLRGKGGPLHVQKGRVQNVLSQAFLLSAQEAGHYATPDVNGYRQEGFGTLDHNIYKARRWSATRAYLRPAMNRQNLVVRTGTTVSKILFDGKQAVGVEFVDKSGSVHHVRSRDTILCAGAIKSPQILQLSGVGDGELLERVGVPLVHHLPGVGANLQDHLAIQIQHSCTKPVSLQPTANLKNAPWIGAQWLFLRSGPGATNHWDAGGFARSNDKLTFPNLMYQFLPLASKSYPTSPTGPHGYQVHVGVMNSDSRGHIRITSPSHRTPPAIQFNYLSTEQDRRDWIDAVRVTREIMAQSALGRYDGGEAAPGPNVQSDDEIWDWVVTYAKSAMHYSGSCKMGTDEMAVVDPNSMKVHGLEGVRVVDASVMPIVTNANTYAPVMMIAEKAADMILGRDPLPPDHTEYFRRDQVRTTELRVATPEKSS
ncbi:MAG TPA: choline dehydrogenase [Pseudonocardia sp.]|uniref:choline dehydrogenase n=1 Tax=Pseudonocardia sp. TaxID=60912 RepID=UPI002B4B8DB8|nr:choline dehydrogenase [Pseudonocardia sp.]HLU59197.1 choline dehydrogenase [Pseudonocardia sp.]